jgi:hypothetical protein
MEAAVGKPLPPAACRESQEMARAWRCLKQNPYAFCDVGRLPANAVPDVSEDLMQFPKELRP